MRLLPAFGLIACATPVFAGETIQPRVPAARANSNECAVHGPGFAKIPGSDTCVKIGGHVRVEYGVGNRGLSWGQGGAAGSGITPYAPPEARGFAPFPAGDVNVDTRTGTGSGAVRTFVRMRAGQGGANTSNPALR